eukprot:TRINITY_DN13935_c0_g1_i4.p1 TRINITY_DN13935_c0_g1~~TRINITY_DN13935_c0_g1_i4.p1  ORF type:complete len:587 (-),score=70.06 TRINITY_DN13935_c0_g1_i4:933-2693(-)
MFSKMPGKHLLAKVFREGKDYAGCLVSLISKQGFRYEGTLVATNLEAQTILLRSAKCYGTEGRKGVNDVPSSDNIYEKLLFNVGELKRIRIVKSAEENEFALMESEEIKEEYKHKLPLPEPEVQYSCEEKNEMACGSHKKTLIMICKDCKSLLCLDCLTEHEEKGCSYPMNLVAYARKELLPSYQAKLKDFGTKRQAADEILREFISASRNIKKGIMELRQKMEKLLNDMSKTLDYLDASEKELLNTNEQMQSNLEAQCKQLEQAIESGNTLHIIDKVLNKLEIEHYVIGDSEKHLAKALDKAITELKKVKELDILNEILQVYNSRYGDSINSSIDKRFIYLITEAYGAAKKLCRFNVQSNELAMMLSVPQWCSIAHMGKRVFVCGGVNPCVDTVSEFVEVERSLVNKAPMNYSKYNHAVQELSENCEEIVLVLSHNPRQYQLLLALEFGLQQTVPHHLLQLVCYALHCEERQRRRRLKGEVEAEVDKGFGLGTLEESFGVVDHVDGVVFVEVKAFGRAHARAHYRVLHLQRREHVAVYLHPQLFRVTRPFQHRPRLPLGRPLAKAEQNREVEKVKEEGGAFFERF